jgi:hypothetical protein
MEASMCWEMDYAFYAELEKAKQAEAREKRAGVIRDLLSGAKTQAEKTGAEAPAANEPVPGK